MNKKEATEAAKVWSEEHPVGSEVVRRLEGGEREVVKVEGEAGVSSVEKENFLVVDIEVPGPIGIGETDTRTVRVDELRDRTIERRTGRQMLRCLLTDEEKLVAADSMADSIGEVTRLEDEISSIKSQLKADIEAADAQVKKQASRLREGFEMRMTETETVLDFDRMTSCETRKDTQDVIQDRDMKEDECQRKLELIYPADFPKEEEGDKDGQSGEGDGPAETAKADEPTEDEIKAAIDVIKTTGRASVGSLQRRLHIGYTRADRLLVALEEKKIVGPPRGSDPREVLIDLDGDSPADPETEPEPETE